eukprot:GFYU01005376.1.p1 GENE.GFYU01005376.1~~GFYU01005376.1.p1  ORF type:complete len:310 (-),score=83.12 GFYU01005376.1:104-1033(-)
MDKDDVFALFGDVEGIEDDESKLRAKFLDNNASVVRSLGQTLAQYLSSSPDPDDESIPMVIQLMFVTFNVGGGDAVTAARECNLVKPVLDAITTSQEGRGDQEIMLLSLLMPHLLGAEGFRSEDAVHLSNDLVQELMANFKNTDDTEIYKASLKALILVHDVKRSSPPSIVIDSLKNHEHNFAILEGTIQVVNGEEQGEAALHFVEDIFSDEKVCSLIYTNDLKLLVEVLVRQLNDTEEQGQKLRAILSALNRVLASTLYRESRHFALEVKQVLDIILDRGQSQDANEDNKRASKVAEDMLTDHIDIFG